MMKKKTVLLNMKILSLMVFFMLIITTFSVTGLVKAQNPSEPKDWFNINIWDYQNHYVSPYGNTSASKDDLYYESYFYASGGYNGNMYIGIYRYSGGYGVNTPIGGENDYPFTCGYEIFYNINNVSPMYSNFSSSGGSSLKIGLILTNITNYMVGGIQYKGQDFVIPNILNNTRYYFWIYPLFLSRNDASQPENTWNPVYNTKTWIQQCQGGEETADFSQPDFKYWWSLAHPWYWSGGILDTNNGTPYPLMYGSVTTLGSGPINIYGKVFVGQNESATYNYGLLFVHDLSNGTTYEISTNSNGYFYTYGYVSDTYQIYYSQETVFGPVSDYTPQFSPQSSSNPGPGQPDYSYTISPLYLTNYSTTLYGFVKNSKGQGISGATIMTNDAGGMGISTTTLNNGSWSLQVPITPMNPSYEIWAYANGYCLNITSTDMLSYEPIQKVQNITLTSTTGSTPTFYKVTFSGSDLNGAEWGVTLNGNTEISTSNSIIFNLPNGTYSYTVSSPYYAATPSSGKLTVNGANLGLSISFSPLPLYTITFIESGLPWYTGCAVTLHWSYWSINKKATTSGTSNSITFNVPDGIYKYVVSGEGYLPSPASGSIVLSGANINQGIEFAKLYGVSFKESGLSVGSTWSVKLGSEIQTITIAQYYNRYGILLPPTGLALEFEVPNGTYSFSVRVVDGYISSPSSGTITVNGADVTQNIKFVVPTYPVTFTESGLLSGASWSVSLAGYTKSTTSTSITFSEPNGTYSYTVGAVSGYTSSPSSGNITVNGAGVTQTISFTHITPPPHSKSCVYGLTPILMSDWSYQYAENIQVGDKIMTYNFTTQTLQDGTVTHITITNETQMYVIDGYLMVAPDQAVWTQRGYVEAQNLTLNDSIYDIYTGLWDHVFSITVFQGSYQMYDFTVNVNENYIAWFNIVKDTTCV